MVTNGTIKTTSTDVVEGVESHPIDGNAVECVCVCECGNGVTRFQAWLTQMGEDGNLEEFFGEQLVSVESAYEDYGRGVELRDVDGRVTVHIDEVTVYGSRETELKDADFDDDLILAGDWEAVAESLTEKHFAEWFPGDEAGVADELAELAAAAAGVSVDIAEQYIEVSGYHRSATFTADEAERAAHGQVPEIARLSGLTPTERIETVIADFVGHLVWLGYGAEEFTDGARRMVRFSVEPEYEEEYISLLAEQARVYDDEAELHIEFTKTAEVNA